VDNRLFLVHLQEKIYIYEIGYGYLKCWKFWAFVPKASRLNVVAIDSPYYSDGNFHTLQKSARGRHTGKFFPKKKLTATRLNFCLLLNLMSIVEKYDSLFGRLRRQPYLHGVKKCYVFG